MSTDEVRAAVRGQDPDGARRAAIGTLEAGTPWLEVARAAALAYGESVDVSPEFPPHGVMIASAAVRLARHLPPIAQPVPIIEAVAAMAAERKLAKGEQRRPLKIAGEISHLSRSFEYAVRAGASQDGVSVYAGLLQEGKERVMAGDALFRVAAEDMVAGGHKLLFSVAAWQLARALGWRAGNVIMAPAVRFVAGGIRERASYETFLAVLGKEKLDLEAVAGNAVPPDDADRSALRAAMRGASPEACARQVIESLKRGLSLDGVASIAVEEAAARLSSANLYDLPALHAFLYTDTARWVLRFSKTHTRLFPLVQACLLLQAQKRPVGAPTVMSSGDEAGLRSGIRAAIESRASEEASARTRGYVSKGYPPATLVAMLGYDACRDAPASGHNVELASAVADEVLVHRPPTPDALPALARILSVCPRDRSAWDALERRFPLTSF